MKIKLLLPRVMSGLIEQAIDNKQGIYLSSLQRINSEGALYSHYSSNPMDLRPAVDSIIEMALDRYKRATDNGRRFVLLMGEQHDRIADMAMQQLLLSRLIDNGLDFSLSYEQDASYLGDKFSKKKLSSKQKHALSELDVSGDAALLSQLFEMPAGSAPYSRQNLMAFCYYNKVTTGFNDAAMISKKRCTLDAHTNRSFIDREWPEYSEALQKETLLQYLNPISSHGMSLRNAVMASRSLRREGLIVHISGASHLMGDNHGSTYGTSMHRYYRDNNVETMLVVAKELRPVLSEEGQYFAGEDVLYLQGYSSKQSQIPSGFGFHAAYEKERDHLKAIFAQSGRETGLFDTTSSRARNFFRRELGERVKPLFQRLDVL